MPRTWQLQEAKNKLSEVVRRARTEGPQVITVRGEEEAVVVSMEEYRERNREPEPAGSLVDFLRTSPLREWAIELDLPDRELEDDTRLNELLAALDDQSQPAS